MADFTLEDMEGAEEMGEEMGEEAGFMDQLKVIPMEEIISFLKVEGILPEDFEAPVKEGEEDMEEMPPEGEGEGYDFSF